MIATLFVPVVTPFDTGGSVDRQALAAHCRRVRDEGAGGVTHFGTTGEGPSLG